eukprot:4118630-Pyramimonas_sp.AAC.1
MTRAREWQGKCIPSPGDPQGNHRTPSHHQDTIRTPSGQPQDTIRTPQGTIRTPSGHHRTPSGLWNSHSVCARRAILAQDALLIW